jgi:hypothetical protein
MVIRLDYRGLLIKGWIKRRRGWVSQGYLGISTESKETGALSAWGEEPGYHERDGSKVAGVGEKKRWKEEKEEWEREKEKRATGEGEKKKKIKKQKGEKNRKKGKELQQLTLG